MALWVFSGVAGSGKSTLAKAVALGLGAAFVDADDYHPESNRQKMRSGLTLNEADREPWLLGLSKALRAQAGRDSVLAFPGLKQIHRQRIAAAVAPAPVHWAYLDATLELVEERLRQRGGFFPAALAVFQFEAFEPGPELHYLPADQAPAELLSQALAWARRP